MKKLINNYKKWNPSNYAIVLLLMIPFLLFILLGFKIDNDFWFLINTGKTILKEGFIHIEPFTIHNGLAFIPQQWLTDIIFYLIYNNFGIRGMYYLVLACNGIIIFILYKIGLLVGDNKKRAVLLAAFADMFLIYVGTVVTRPQLFDCIVFSLELLLIESYIKYNKKIYLYFIPLISLFVINYHASMWLMIFVLMIPYFVENIILKIKKRNSFALKPLVIVAVISIVLGIINPYKLEAINYLFGSYGVSKINDLVAEMAPVDIVSLLGKIIITIVFFLLYSFYYNKKKNQIRYVLLFMGILYLTLSHYKGTLYLGIIIPLILGFNFKKNIKDSDFKIGLTDKIIYVMGSLGIIVLLMTTVPLKDGVKINEFADYLDQNANYDIKLFTDYNNGAYMEYRGYKCYIDPRAEVFLKANNHVEDIFDEYYDLEIEKIDPQEFLDKYQFDYLLVSTSTRLLLYELKHNSGYVEVLSKELSEEDKETLYLYKRIGEINKNEKSN